LEKSIRGWKLNRERKKGGFSRSNFYRPIARKIKTPAVMIPRNAMVYKNNFTASTFLPAR
jgi:hypothetical protein